LLDEPLSNLDARLRLEMRAELKRIHAQFKTTIVFVTHDQWEAMTLATTIAVMNGGTLQQIGSPNDIYNRPANRFVAEFVGTPPMNIIEGGSGSDDLFEQASAFLAARLQAHSDIGSVGIRPEAIQLAMSFDQIPPDSFHNRVTVTGVLPTGGSWIVEAKTASATLFLTMQSAPNLRAGDGAYLWISPDAFHVFDKAGNRLSDADEVFHQPAN
jgi:iron(III) transport system ATP-binding protein